MGPEADWEADAPPASSMAGAGVQHERHGSRDRGQVQLEADEASHRRPPATEGGYGRMITSISVRVWGCSELPYARRLAMLLSGQVLSLLLVTTGATSALLVGRGLAAPTFVAMCNYLMLTVVYGGTLLCSCQQQSGFLSLWASPEAQEETPRDRHLIAKLILFALADVEANYLIVRAYQYAPMTNITLLDALTIPTVVLLSTVFLGVTYARTHVAGISMCLLGLFCLVAYDVARVRDDQKQAARNILGDLMAVSAAVCYGISNILQEHLACRLPLQRGPHQSGNMNTHARTHARARTHTRMHTHAHTHTQIRLQRGPHRPGSGRGDGECSAAVVLAGGDDVRGGARVECRRLRPAGGVRGRSLAVLLNGPGHHDARGVRLLQSLLADVRLLGCRLRGARPARAFVPPLPCLLRPHSHGA